MAYTISTLGAGPNEDGDINDVGQPVGIGDEVRDASTVPYQLLGGNPETNQVLVGVIGTSVAFNASAGSAAMPVKATEATRAAAHHVHPSDGTWRNAGDFGLKVEPA